MIEHFPALIGIDGPNNGSNETHFTDEDLGRAIAMPASEAQLLHDITLRVSPTQAVEIGAYVGWSTAHILAADEPFATQTLSVIDPFTESGGSVTQTAERFWQNIDRADRFMKVQVFKGHSPELLAIVAPRSGWDFAVIDGHHSGDQPRKDIQGLLPHLTDDAIVVWHDAWIPTVKAAIDWLVMQGWQDAALPTANLLTICYRGHRPAWLDDIEARAREYVADERNEREPKAVANG